jgi:hypothetical protein
MNAFIQAELAKLGNGNGSTGLAPNPLKFPGGEIPGGQWTQEQVNSLLAMTGADVTSREALTPQPLTGGMPIWVPPKLRNLAQTATQAGIWDPYLGASGSPADDRVFMGGTVSRKKQVKVPTASHMRFAGENMPDQPPTENNKTVKETGDSTLTVTQAMNQPYMWDEQKVHDTMKMMRDAGQNVTSFDQMKQVWDGMVQRASAMYSLSSGQRKVTPWDVLDMYKKEAPAPGPGDPRFNGTKTQTATSINQLSEGQAWHVLQSTLSQMLGRDPSDQEMRNFAYKMNSMAASNPSVSKTITQYKNGQAVSANTTQSGGFTTDDALQAAYDKAQDNPDYAEYQSASTYYNAALSALGAIGTTG